MQKLHLSILINAPKQKVWDFMLNLPTYRIWTSTFSEESESTYEGSWEQGAKIKFVATKDNCGITSEIAENRPGNFISIKHLGVIQDGQEDFDSTEAKKWASSFENYTFTEKNGQTELQIDQDVPDEHLKMMTEMWEKATAKLKELCEKFISVEAVINAPIEKVWECWNQPEHIKGWAFASDTWEAPYAENDLRLDGKFVTTMAAKDGSFKFDFTGIYDQIDLYKKISYAMPDGRRVYIFFDQTPAGIKVTEVFAMENIHPEEKQKEGWQAIINNFKKYTESK